MNKSDYELILELYKEKNISRASQKMFLSQPAITRKIQKIEMELGCQILFRSNRGIVFTPKGESLIPHVRSILNHIQQMEDQAAASADEICGSLTIGASMLLAHYKMIPLLKQFSEKYPNVDVQFSIAESRSLLGQLRQNMISVGITRGEFPWEETRHCISSEPVYLVCSREHIGRPLDQYPYIRRHTDMIFESQVYRWLNAHHLASVQTITGCDSQTSLEMVRFGMGWSILPRLILNSFDGYMEELHLEDGSPFVRNTYILCKHISSRLPQIQAFIEYLQSSFMSL